MSPFRQGTSMTCVCLSTGSQTLLFYPWFVCSFFIYLFIFMSNTIRHLLIKLTGNCLIAAIYRKSASPRENDLTNCIQNQPIILLCVCAVLWPGPCSHRFWCRWNCRTGPCSVLRYFKTASIVTFYRKILRTDLFLIYQNCVIKSAGE